MQLEVTTERNFGVEGKVGDVIKLMKTLTMKEEELTNKKTFNYKCCRTI